MMPIQDRISAANAEVISAIQNTRVELSKIDSAKNSIEVLRNQRCILHSGPPVEWDNMCAAMRGAILGAIVYEGWAKNIEAADELAGSGSISFESANENRCVGPMAGVISPSMPVMRFTNTTYGNESFVTINEGLGKALRFGANSDSVIHRLKWIEQKFAPMLNEALDGYGPVDVTSMIARSLQRGDECHNRNKSATSLFIRTIAPALASTNFEREEIAEGFSFLDGNDHFFLNLSMGASKATMDATLDIEGSSIIACMCSNGYEFGVKLAGMRNKWFAAPAPKINGKYFAGFGESDANPSMGDSYVSEATGLGGFAMGAAPGIGRFIGISVKDCLEYSKRMYEITIAEHGLYKIPALEFRGTPLGIDIRKVVETSILPVINTGIAHKTSGIGQVGAGVVFPPMECFQKAYESLLTKYKNQYCIRRQK